MTNLRQKSFYEKWDNPNKHLALIPNVIATVPFGGFRFPFRVTGHFIDQIHARSAKFKSVSKIAEAIKNANFIEQGERKKALDQSKFTYLLNHKISRTFYLYCKKILIVAKLDTTDNIPALVTNYPISESRWLRSWLTKTPRKYRIKLSRDLLLSYLGITIDEARTGKHPVKPLKY